MITSMVSRHFEGLQGFLLLFSLLLISPIYFSFSNFNQLPVSANSTSIALHQGKLEHCNVFLSEEQLWLSLAVLVTWLGEWRSQETPGHVHHLALPFLTLSCTFISSLSFHLFLLSLHPCSLLPVS